VHAPGGRLNDGFRNTDEVWERYCDFLEASDVAVLGITDYFSLEPFFAARKRFEDRYPDSEKVLFPNLELRLTESVNAGLDLVDFHVILKPDLTEDKAHQLLSALRTELRDPENPDRHLTCEEIKTDEQLRTASVTRESVEKAVKSAFGGGQVTDPTEILLLVPSNNNGIRADVGNQRKAKIADQIDRLAHAVFGNPKNANYYLRTDRAEDGSATVAKPVFGGCDAHDFTQLEAWLGREVTAEDSRKSVTWVKADPTFEGLLQTLAEPSSRVRLQANRPDFKEPYKYLSAVRFSGTEDFPDEIVFNENLVAVIGSRSSGKSSLLAYVAYAVDPEETRKKQLAVEPQPNPADIGPAPGKTWDSVADIECTVEWAEPSTTNGRVIYVPQNSLYAISQRPEDVKAKIEPTLWRLDPDLKIAKERMATEDEAANEAIRVAVARWFRTGEAIHTRSAELRDRGDKAAIEERHDQIGAEIAALREQSELTEEDARHYEQLMAEIAAKQARLRVINDERTSLAPHLEVGEAGYRAHPMPKAEVRLSPAPEELPDELRARVNAILAEAEGELSTAVAKALVTYQGELDEEAARLQGEETTLREENAELIERSEANREVDELVKRRAKQKETLAEIEADTKALEGLEVERVEAVERISSQLDRRETAIKLFLEAFDANERRSDLLKFDVEAGIPRQLREDLSGRLNRRSKGKFFSDGSELLDISDAQQSAGEFLAEIESGRQKVLKDQVSEEVTADVLCATPQVRFLAEIEDDRIGGFKASTMTPGKQALFALTLILEETEAGWPLLIDQPEDDLDSRSIAGDLVDYLAQRKSERQIIMVSHDANLVVGADAEQVIVTNRHGVDRPNADRRLFDYFSGSLEHTRERNPDAATVLASGGIREHACDILDGGEEAFRKRKRKYKI
jgi:hypothetical protein